MPCDRKSNHIPLSYAQQRLWFIDQLEPHNTLYNIPLAIRLSGHLNIEALAATFTTLFARHEVLRTTFATHEGQPVQVISPPAPVSFPLEDLSGLSPDAREHEAQRLAREEASLPFDLSQGPLLRVRLLRLAADEYVVLLTMHHIISDGWSLDILSQEVAALYEAYVRGEASPLPELPIQYADYAVWQREYLQGEVLEQQMQYWRTQLGGQLPTLELPTDHPAPTTPSHRGARQSFVLAADTVERLRALCRSEGATLFMVLLAAFKTLLYRYTGEEDVVVGTPIAGRTRGEVEGLIGFFVNTLVLRTEVRGELSFRELIRRVREVCLGAYAHQDVPFEKIVEELQPERSLSRTPLFQVMFVLQSEGKRAESEGEEMPGRERIGVGNETARFDLTVTMVEAGGELRGVLRYKRDVYSAAQMGRMAEHLRRMLEAVAEGGGEQRLRELEMLSAAERREVVIEFNETARAYESESCLHEMFEAQVARTPEAVAVVSEAEEISYQELNARANQLAHYLQ
ncbi:MAG TPA: condensation domain-containing protein, partial [Pyrinomonadaceae bacterium]|nr:condensation domain-containing protein [Pyrinomonadaceae bacterium]